MMLRLLLLLLCHFTLNLLSGLVHFAGKKTSKYFVGQVVEDKNGDDVTVKCVKKSGKVFLWLNRGRQ